MDFPISPVRDLHVRLSALEFNLQVLGWLAGHPAPLQLAHYLTRPAGQIVLFISPRFLSRSLFFRPLLLLFDYLFIASFFQICVLMKI